MSCEIYDLGVIEYGRAWSFQKEVFSRVKSFELSHALIILHHQPVITLGRNSDYKNILLPKDALSLKGIGLFEIERGGDVTYHGPGQITVYPIFNLADLKKDIHWFLRELETVIIDFLSEFGIPSQRRPGLTGVWVGEKKIASIGIAIRHWITFHGLSINIKEADLANFSVIRPCGMDIEMTSLESVLGKEIKIEETKMRLVDKFNAHFALNTLIAHSTPRL